MEFRYRAGDERSRSSPTPPTASSGSAAARVMDDDATGYRREIIFAAAPLPAGEPPAPDPGEQLRREAKGRIRERILREEEEAIALEAEVRYELMKERLTLLRSGVARPSIGAPADGVEARAATTVPADGVEARAPLDVGMTANSASPILLEPMQPQPKANCSSSSSMLAKRKNPVIAASTEPSTFSAATSSKKQKPSGLTCSVCDITLNGEKPMQDHLKGKSHLRKAAMVGPSPVPVVEEDENKEHVRCSKANSSAAALPAMLQNSGVAAAASTVPATAGSMKQDPGHLACKICGVTSTSELALKEHLRGKKHQRTAATVALPPLPSMTAPEQEEEREYTPKKLTMRTNAGEMYDVMQMDGFQLCELCDVKTADLVTMMCHLQGSKHASKFRQKQLLGAGSSPPAAAVLAGQPKSSEAHHAVVAGTGHTTQHNGSMEVTGQAAGELVAAVAPPATPQLDDMACPGTSATPMEVDELAEAGGAAAIAEEEKAAADAEGAATASQDGNETTRTRGVAVAVAPPGQQVKIQVEGEMCATVVRHADGGLSCAPCCVHGCDKDGMLQHLYTRAHLAVVRRLADDDEAAELAAKRTSTDPSMAS